VTVRLLLWSLADSKTTLDELRAKLPELPEGDHWISDPAGERFESGASFPEELVL